jgi:hypothetical protein
LDPAAGEQEAGADEKRVGPLARKRRESRVDFIAVAGVENLDLQAQGASGSFHLSQRRLGRGNGRVHEHGQLHRSRHQPAKQFEPLRRQLGRQEIDAGQIAAGPGETGDKTEPDRILRDSEDDGDGRGCRFCRHCNDVSETGEHGDPSANQLGCQRRELLDVTFGPAVQDGDVVALDIAHLLQAIAECAQTL